ncbi:hypothetical protein [Azospirillum brasilense]|uniref:Uncharacterized protein n=1 Tax=Azospirillum brasilense TaxID=192 RepID=A0A235H9U5_AZOBR|nr:hypothetical protein [Azospirillum brasilense]OYD82528.1 hypothetical protein CHT98_20235 [Azospirillum brasilense]
MTKPQFINLTGANGKPLRVRAERIDAFERLISETAVYIGSETYKVTETPEQIDALLGVTAEPVRDAAPELLDVLGMVAVRLRAMGGMTQREQIETADLVDAAIAAATGRGDA